MKTNVKIAPNCIKEKYLKYNPENNMYTNCTILP